MGWFSRNQADTDTGRRPGGRSNQSSESELRELRVRARRRLVGALALVIVAVIFVPMLFDSSVTEENLPVPVVVPSIDTLNEQTDLLAQTGNALGDPNEGTIQSAATPTDVASESTTTATEPPTLSADSGSSPEPAVAAPTEPSRAAVAPPPPRAEPPAPAPTPTRTDDGSVALALLEGKMPPAPAASSQGSFTLQIAAYTTEADARGRRDKLVASGVTNAYVEQASVDGRATYRLRVGPFPTRDAAQAAQARLRALGYDNGFISSK